MGLIKEFKEFAMKGNVVDMAVGIIIGGAFGKIVTSMVGDIVMPLVGALQKKGGSMGAQFLWLGSGEKPASLEAAKASGEAYIAWGPFAQTTLDFVIVAFAIFALLKIMNTAKARFEKKAAETPAAPAAPAEDVLLLREIRDALKAR
jgi:large conductance mechanosensitive channel